MSGNHCKDLLANPNHTLFRDVVTTTLTSPQHSCREPSTTHVSRPKTCATVNLPKGTPLVSDLFQLISVMFSHFSC